MTLEAGQVREVEDPDGALYLLLRPRNPAAWWALVLLPDPHVEEEAGQVTSVNEEWVKACTRLWKPS